MSFYQRQLYATGLFLFLVPTVIFTLSSLILMVNLPLGGVIYPVSFFLALFLVFWWVFKSEKKISINVFLFGGIGTLFTVFALGLSGIFYDVSFDGQWYHQDAILFLSDGWNPFYDAVIPDGLVSGNNANYINHYPKATWIYQSVVYLFWGNIEWGKSLHFHLLFSFGFLLFSFLSQKTVLSVTQRIILVLMAVISPITLGQLFSFYVDGILYCFLGLFLLFLLNCVVHHEKRWPLLFLSFVFLINIKFTGLVYALLFAFGCFFYQTWVAKKLSLGPVFRFILISIMGVFVFGYPTYGRNLMEKNHIFFPIMGKNNEGRQIAQAQYPRDFYGLNRFEKFLSAHRAIPNYTAETHPSVPKKTLFNPKFIQSSIPYYNNHQPVTMSPFGPFELELWVFFGLSMIFFFLFVRERLIYFSCVLLLLSMLIQPEFWNLRYAPQLLWFILLVQGALLMSSYRFVRLFSLVFCILFITNGIIASKENWRWVANRNQQLNETLLELSKKTVVIYPGWMGSFTLKLKDYNITSFPSTSRGEGGAVEFYEGDFTGWKYKIVQE
jgi:hypothetical protein